MKEYNLNNILSHREQGLSWRQIGAIYAEEGEDSGIIGERIRGNYRKYRSKLVTKHENQDVTSVREMNDAIDLTPEALLERHGFDPDLFELVDSSAYLSDKGVRTRIKVRERIQPWVEEAFVNAVRRVNGEHESLPCPEHKKGTLIVPLFDLHFGKSTVQGGMSPDMWLGAVLANIQHRKADYDNCIVLIGQDTFNVDTYRLTTTKGTPMRQWTSAEQMYEMGFFAIMHFLEGLYKEFPNLKVTYTHGNHDRILGYTLAVGLREVFRGRIEFTVTSSPRYYTYVDHTLIGVTHGDDLVSYSGVMATEASDLWSMARERIWIKGHLHHLTVEEKEGMTIIGVPSPSLQDEWHRDKGYLAVPRGVLIGIGNGHLKEIITVGSGI